MARASLDPGFRRGLARWSKDLEAFATGKRIHETLKQQQEHAPTIAQALIKHAVSGHGPFDTPYPAYSPAYLRRAKKAGGQKRFLRGIGNTGRKGGMLGEERFGMKLTSNGRTLWLVWSSASPRMGIYAEVHQRGLPIGRNGPRKQRKWMHLYSRSSAKAVRVAYRAAVKVIVAAFNRKWSR